MKSDEQLMLLYLGDDLTGSAYCTNAEGTLVVSTCYICVVNLPTLWLFDK